jgi:hypothetical protein
MLPRKVFLFIVFLIFINSNAQNIKGLVIDMETKMAVPYASIQINSNRGTITNEEGYFSIDISDFSPEVLLISSMGYEPLSFPVANLTAELNTIALKQAVIALNEVLVQNKMPTAEDIIREVNNALPINYDKTYQRYQMFYRQTSYMEFDNLDLTINKATGVNKKQIGQASAQLDSLTNSIITSKMIEFKDYSGDILLKNKDTSKIAIQKATKLIDSKKDFSIDKIQERAQNIILQYLDTTLTYKLKTGLFKIEDSLSLNQDESEKDTTNEYSMDNIKSGVIGSLKRGQFYEEAFISKILNPDLYRYSFIDASFIDGSYIYVVSFRPRKARSKFSGTLYISANDYAVLKADYAYSEGKEGTKFNFKLLLGIKFIENINKGTVIFRRNPEGKYYPYYIKKESGNYIYVRRPLKFIENSSEKYKVAFDFLLEGGSRERQELLILNTTVLGNKEFEEYSAPDEVPYTLLEKFEPTIWQNSQIIEPLEEMKNFKVTNK